MSASTAALAGFGIVAVVDWIAVATGAIRVEWFAKPAALVLLTLWAATGPAPPVGLVVALVCSFLGDVALLLPEELFLAGLGAFLVAHLAYVAAFHAPVPARLAAWVVVLAATSPLASRLLRAVREPRLRVAVAVYTAAIALMVGSAAASGSGLATAGALLFLASDATIAWSRFVRAFAGAETFIVVTYHLGQLGLVAALR